MKQLGLSAVRIGWVTMMLGSACNGPAIEFNSQTGGKGGDSNTGGDVGTGGANPSSGGSAPVGTGGRASAGSGGRATVETGGAGPSGGKGGAGEGGEPPLGEGCIISTTHADPSGEFVGIPSYQRVSYDEDARILTRERSDRPDISNVTLRVRLLLNDEGQSPVQTGEDFFNNRFWRFDRLRDAAGNVTESMATYTTDFDFSVTPPPPHYSWQHYEHTYSASGALAHTATTDANYGNFDSRDYSEDAQGRCSRIERSGSPSGVARTEQETRSYEGNSLVGSTINGTVNTAKYEIVFEYQYDDQGRLTRFVQDGSNAFITRPPDGTPDVTRTYEYAADGSVTIAGLDLTNDVATDQAVFWRFTPQCAEIWAALPKPSNVSCRFPDAAEVPSILDLAN